MKTITSSEFDHFCRRAKISIPNSALGIGNDLSHGDGLLRSIVVHFTQSDIPAYLCKILNIIFTLEPTWLLVPRYKFLSAWNIPEATPAVAAVSFDANNLATLPSLLLDRLPNIQNVGDDLIVLSGKGHVILRFDHHFLDEGLGLDINDIDESNRLLVALNTIGAEIELYYKNG